MQPASQGQKDRTGANKMVHKQGGAGQKRTDDVVPSSDHPARSSEDEGTQDEEEEEDPEFAEGDEDERDDEEEDVEDEDEETEEDGEEDGDEKTETAEANVKQVPPDVRLPDSRDEVALRQAEQKGRLACIVWRSKRVWQSKPATRCYKNLADGTFEVPDKDLYGLSPSALVKRFGPTGGIESRIGDAIHVWLEGKAQMTEDGMGIDPGLFPSMDEFTGNYDDRLQAIGKKFRETEPAGVLKSKPPTRSNPSQQKGVKRPQPAAPSEPQKQKRQRDKKRTVTPGLAAAKQHPPVKRTPSAAVPSGAAVASPPAQQTGRDGADVSEQVNMVDLGGAVLSEETLLKLDNGLLQKALKNAQFIKLMSDWLSLG